MEMTLSEFNKQYYVSVMSEVTTDTQLLQSGDKILIIPTEVHEDRKAYVVINQSNNKEFMHIHANNNEECLNELKRIFNLNISN